MFLNYSCGILHFKGNFTKEAQHSRERYQERTNNAVTTVRNSMQNVSRSLWKCDPKKHVKGWPIFRSWTKLWHYKNIFLIGETYDEITNLLQGYVQNEVDLNPERTCRENCLEYSFTKSHGCYKNLFCRQQRSCNGKIVDCKFFDSDMWICNAVSLFFYCRYIFNFLEACMFATYIQSYTYIYYRILLVAEGMNTSNMKTAECLEESKVAQEELPR